MKTTQEMIAVMQAYTDGKEIEFRQRCDVNKTYKVIDLPSWDWDNYDYRVKETPEYVPFTFDDAEFLIGKVVKHKKDNWVELITYCNQNETPIGPYEHLLDNYTFIDGSPCGKLNT